MHSVVKYQLKSEPKNLKILRTFKKRVENEQNFGVFEFLEQKYTSQHEI